MAAKLGTLGAVSYGIGVQNRYSAFLDDDDGFSGSQAASAKRLENSQQHLNNLKQKSPAIGLQKSHSGVSGKPAAKANGPAKQPLDPIKGAQLDQHFKRLNASDRKFKSGAPQHSSANNNNVQAPKQATNSTNHHKQSNSNQDNTASRLVRNQGYSNQHHQSNVSHQHNSSNNYNNSKENNKFLSNKNNQQQRNSNRRPFYTNDKRVAQLGAGGDELQTSSYVNNIGPQSEEEKRRRQQKRALDLKHKGPEKREARRQQLAGTSNQPEVDQQQTERAQKDGDVGGSKAQRSNKRQVGQEANRNQDEASRAFRGNGARGRGRRTEQANLENNSDKREGQQAGRGFRFGADRPPRNRNGFGAGSRGSRSRLEEQSKSYGRDLDRQKPIPNFSDKLDFPSLAS